jgi:hypothetical protein
VRPAGRDATRAEPVVIQNRTESHGQIAPASRKGP